MKDDKPLNKEANLKKTTKRFTNEIQTLKFKQPDSFTIIHLVLFRLFGLYGISIVISY